jgi:hypothetical protein
LEFWKRKIFLSKSNFGGKKIYLAKEYFDFAKKLFDLKMNGLRLMFDGSLLARGIPQLLNLKCHK